MKREPKHPVFKFERDSEDDPTRLVVFADGVEIGMVYYDEDAWSQGRWFIDGDRVMTKRGGVWGATTKPLGYPNRTSAAWELARKQSVLLISAACKEDAA